MHEDKVDPHSENGDLEDLLQIEDLEEIEDQLLMPEGSEEKATSRRKKPGKEPPPLTIDD